MTRFKAQGFNNTFKMKALEKLCDFIEFISNKFKINNKSKYMTIVSPILLYKKILDMFQPSIL